MARTGLSAHADDEALSSLIDDETLPSVLLQRHVAGCDQCRVRLAELRTLRHLLNKVGAYAIPLSADLTRRVISRLRTRQAAIGSVNEVFAAVRALIHGFSFLFGAGGPPTNGSERPSVGSQHG
jgi:hypothetical protein